jgi:tRNA 2-thiouridine synthesizing protein A
VVEIDAIGLSCPMPVLRLQKILRDSAPKTRVTLLATDPMAKVDVVHFASENGHRLIGQTTQAKAAPGGLDLLIFEIEKA